MPSLGAPVETLWTMTGRRFPDRSTTPLPDHVDVVVIGGGFTGLATALELSRAGRGVVVLEGDWLGTGSGAASSGIVTTHFSAAAAARLPERLGLRRAEHLLALMGRAPDVFFRNIELENIDCDARQVGWLQPAYGRGMAERLRDWTAEWLSRGRPVEFLAPDEVEVETGLAGLRGALLDRSGGTVQPVDYVAGLAMAVIRRGGLIREQAPVTAVQPSPLGWRVAFDGGAIYADSVILATNAHHEGVGRRLARNGAAFEVHHFATTPLERKTAARIAANRRPVGDPWIHPLVYRLDSRNRLVGAGLAAIPAFARDRVVSSALSRLKRRLRLDQEPLVEWSWSTPAILTPGLSPRLYRFDEGFYGALACNGFGLAMTAQLGRVLALAAMGGDPERMPIPLERPNRLLFPQLLAARNILGARIGRL